MKIINSEKDVKEQDNFYTKLSDYKLKHFSERDKTNKLDEQKILSNNNYVKSTGEGHSKNKMEKNFTNYNSNNYTYEDNSKFSNLANFNQNNIKKDFYLQKNYDENIKRDILQKTKRLLNKNNQNNSLIPRNFQDEKNKNDNKKNDTNDSLFFKDFENNDKNNKFNYRTDKDKKTIIINNNININNYIKNRIKENFLGEPFFERFPKEKINETDSYTKKKEFDYNNEFYLNYFKYSDDKSDNRKKLENNQKYKRILSNEELETNFSYGKNENYFKNESKNLFTADKLRSNRNYKTEFNYDSYKKYDCYENFEKNIPRNLSKNINNEDFYKDERSNFGNFEKKIMKNSDTLKNLDLLDSPMNNIKKKQEYKSYRLKSFNYVGK